MNRDVFFDLLDICFWVFDNFYFNHAPYHSIREDKRTRKKNNQKEHLELLKQLQPNLIEKLSKQPPWFVVQMTRYLWMIYIIHERLNLRKETISRFFELSQGVQPEAKQTSFVLVPICVQRIGARGKTRAQCKELGKECIYKPIEIAKCPILNEQLSKVLRESED